MATLRRHTAGVMGQLWALLLPLGFGGVAIVGQLQGLTAETMGPSQRVRAPPSACGCLWMLLLLSCCIGPEQMLL